MRNIIRAMLGVSGLVSIAIGARADDASWIYSVQATAEVQATPPAIALHWTRDASEAVQRYTISRKSLGAATWDAPVTISGDADSYADINVTVGARYEYQIEKLAHNIYSTTNYTGYGYVASAIDAPLVESRGRVILVVDASVADALGGELERLRQDLIGDGWTVARRDVSRGDSPANVRAAIQEAYRADPAHTQAVFLFGHIPVARSGNLNVDGHQARPMPADVFYGDMSGVWPDDNGDGVYDQNRIPADIVLEVGRVDFADLPGAMASVSYPNETELLRRYLNKDHAFRHAMIRPALRAIIGNGVGDRGGEAVAASGYRNFAPLVGSANIETVNTGLDTPVSDRWITALQNRDYLWAYGCGSGGDYAINGLGTSGPFNGVWSSDFIQLNPKCTFYLLFGSWFSEWNKTDNLLRSALTAQDYGLGAAWSGRPHLYFHAMGIGETIGYGIRLSQNNDGLQYRNQLQRQARGIHIAWMGDPTLRLYAIAPPRDVSAASTGDGMVVIWRPSDDAVLGYAVYRSNGGAFNRVSDGLTTDTRLVDSSGTSGTVYMVRAVTQQTTPGGRFFNGSEGVFSSSNVPNAGVADNGAANAVPPATSAPSNSPHDVVWLDDAPPPGANLYGDGQEGWNWVNGNPAPFSGNAAHQSIVASGLHHHFFGDATVGLRLGAGDTIYAYVYLDPANPPREVMLSWCTSDGWEHRAFWGDNAITVWGADGTAGRRYMGALPATGQWVRLEVPAAAVQLEGLIATGMGFSLVNGRATWDQVGKSTLRSD
jgi:hypothetical protein